MQTDTHEGVKIFKNKIIRKTEHVNVFFALLYPKPDFIPTILSTLTFSTDLK